MLLGTFTRRILASAIKQCDKERFPNLFTLLNISCTLPVTSRECERYLSAMRCLRTWLRSSMTMMKRMESICHHVDHCLSKDKLETA